jgi:predicted HicB family RNase H-like nuclease
MSYAKPMPRGKPRLKTTTIQLRTDPRLKTAAETAAQMEHRNLSNWIEALILTRCRQLNVPTPTPPSQETQA